MLERVLELLLELVRLRLVVLRLVHRLLELGLLQGLVLGLRLELELRQVLLGRVLQRRQVVEPLHRPLGRLGPQPRRSLVLLLEGHRLMGRLLRPREEHPRQAELQLALHLPREVRLQRRELERALLRLAFLRPVLHPRQAPVLVPVLPREEVRPRHRREPPR